MGELDAGKPGEMLSGKTVTHSLTLVILGNISGPNTHTFRIT